MPVIELLNALKINCDTGDRQASCKMFNKQANGSYTNRKQEVEAWFQCYINTEGIQNDNTNPMVKDKDNSEINYFLPGPS